MLMRTIRTSVRRRLAEVAARREVAEKGPLAAAEAMRQLNCYAKDSPLWKETIYRAKGALIRALYFSDVNCEVIQHTRPRPCLGKWDKDRQGFVGCRGRACERCGGTGIYDPREMMLFAFEIQGEPFFWHQYTDEVDWPVKTVRTKTIAGGGKYRYQGLTKWQAELEYAKVRLYLQAVERPLEEWERIGLWDAFMADVVRLYLRLGDWWQRRRLGVSR